MHIPRLKFTLLTCLFFLGFELFWYIWLVHPFRRAVYAAQRGFADGYSQHDAASLGNTLPS